VGAAGAAQATDVARDTRGQPLTAALLSQWVRVGSRNGEGWACLCFRGGGDDRNPTPSLTVTPFTHIRTGRASCGQLQRTGGVRVPLHDVRGGATTGAKTPFLFPYVSVELCIVSTCPSRLTTNTTSAGVALQLVSLDAACPRSLFWKRVVMGDLEHARAKAITQPVKMARDVKSYQVHSP
jgi:hypothetical protein